MDNNQTTLKDWAVPIMIAVFLGWQANTQKNTTDGAVTAAQMETVIADIATLKADVRTGMHDRYTAAMGERSNRESERAREKLQVQINAIEERQRDGFMRIQSLETTIKNNHN